MNLIQSGTQRDAFTRPYSAILLNGAHAELLSEAQIRREYPFLNFDDARFLIGGGLAQRHRGTERNDTVAWGYARFADDQGVYIIHNCDVTRFRIENGKCLAVESSKAVIGAKHVECAVAGNSDDHQSPHP